MSKPLSNSQVRSQTGVMLNAYPDSIGKDLGDIVNLLMRDEFKDVFSCFYILPTFFNSDLDRGFSIIDYDLNPELVSKANLADLKKLGISLKFDIVLNHLSVASPQFQDLLENGENSKYKDFFIDWNQFWQDQGELNEDGIIVPNKEHLDKLFMRKPGLPVLKVQFPDGSERPYWNTFYQQISYNAINAKTLSGIEGLSYAQAEKLSAEINEAIVNSQSIKSLNFKENNALRDQLIETIEGNRSYLGQMDVNANSQLVWDFYEDTLKKLAEFGCKILRLDAFAYLHKEIGKSNFFNTPGTWDYLERIKKIADKHNLTLLPEIHAEYGIGLHREVAEQGYAIYDFFFPGLVIHTLEKADSRALKSWIREIKNNNYRTVNMLGCHDGIPVLDLKGGHTQDGFVSGLLQENEIEDIMNIIMDRGGRVKNLYDPDGNKISYYQINATFYSALGENDKKLLLARAIQIFMPGIPQVWYLDLFAGKNNYKAADKGGTGNHKEINRTTLSLSDIESKLNTALVKNQLQLLRFRNTCKAFSGTMELIETAPKTLHIKWTSANDMAELTANLKTLEFNIEYTENGTQKTIP